MEVLLSLLNVKRENQGDSEIAHILYMVSGSSPGTTWSSKHNWSTA